MHIGGVVDRVRTLIEQSGLPRAEFASRIGIDGPKLSKSLSGDRRFSSLELARVADVTGTTVDWILRGDDAPAALAARHDDGGIARSSATDEAVATARKYALARADLAELGYRQPKPDFHREDHGRTAITDGEKLAAEAINFLRMSDGDDHTSDWDLIPKLEDAFKVDICARNFDSASFDGLTWRDETCRLIVVATSSVPGRRRFTLAHELAHLLAEDDQTMVIDNPASDRRHPTEVRANTFAAAFLMPENDLRNRLDKIPGSVDDKTFAELACDFIVTPSTLAWRLHNLKFVSRERCGQLQKMRTIDAVNLAGKTAQLATWLESSVQPRLPRRLIEDAATAYLSGETTLRPFANLVNIDVNRLRSALEAERSEPEPVQEPDYGVCAV